MNDMLMNMNRLKGKVEAYVVSTMEDNQRTSLLDNLAIAVESVEDEAEQRLRISSEKSVCGGKAVSDLCGCIEAIITHELREKTISSGKEKSNFWPVAERITPKDSIQMIYRLDIRQNDENRAHVWVRHTLREGTIGGFLSLLRDDLRILRTFYRPSAFVRDMQKMESATNLIGYAIASINFKIELDSFEGAKQERSPLVAPEQPQQIIYADSNSQQSVSAGAGAQRSRRKTRGASIKIATIEDAQEGSGSTLDAFEARQSNSVVGNPFSVGRLSLPGKQENVDVDSIGKGSQSASSHIRVAGSVEENGVPLHDDGESAVLTTSPDPTLRSNAEAISHANAELSRQVSGISMDGLCAENVIHEAFRSSSAGLPQENVVCSAKEFSSDPVAPALVSPGDSSFTVSEILRVDPLVAAHESTAETSCHSVIVDQPVSTTVSVSDLNHVGILEEEICSDETCDRVAHRNGGHRARELLTEQLPCSDVKRVVQQVIESVCNLPHPVESANPEESVSVQTPLTHAPENLNFDQVTVNLDDISDEPVENAHAVHADLLLPNGSISDKEEGVRTSHCEPQFSCEDFCYSSTPTSGIPSRFSAFHGVRSGSFSRPAQASAGDSLDFSLPPPEESEPLRSEHGCSVKVSSIIGVILDGRGHSHPDLSHPTSSSIASVPCVLARPSAESSQALQSCQLGNKVTESYDFQEEPFLSPQEDKSLKIKGSQQLECILKTPRMSLSESPLSNAERDFSGLKNTSEPLDASLRLAFRSASVPLKMVPVSSLPDHWMREQMLRKVARSSTYSSLTSSSIEADSRMHFDTGNFSSGSETDSVCASDRSMSLLADLGITDDFIGLKEDHFATPDLFMGFSSCEELENAISSIKEHIKLSTSKPQKKKELIAQLVHLRLKLHELKEARTEKTAHVTRVLGHRFQRVGKVPQAHVCDTCGKSILPFLQNLCKCVECGFCTHRSCLKSVDKACVNRKLSDVSYVLQICPETGLASQEYRCADCRKRLSFRDAAFEVRLCDYTGQYFCSQCHWNDMAAIPGRIIHNWDFTLQKVSRQSKQILQLLAKKPILSVKDLNPALFNFVDELRDVRVLRQQVIMMKSYLTTCRLATEERLLLLLQNRQHFVDDSDMYSLQDLIDINKNELLDELMRSHATFAKHIKFDCPLCQGRGFTCEVCNENEIIFPFDSHVTRCEACKATFHRLCYERGRCPRCVRIEKRLNNKSAALLGDENV